METGEVLIPESLQETLWRLEEIRQGFRKESTAHVKEALDWVLTRQGLPGSYSNLFMPTKKDLTEGLRLLTGERKLTNVATRHILGEEALRTCLVWKLETTSAVTKALKGFNQILENKGGKSGHYCCYTCTIAFLRTLAVVKPNEWDEILEKGMNRIKRARTQNSRWHGYPFYYMLLALSEMDTPSTQDELRHAKKVAGKLLKRYNRDDRIARFRRLGLEAALNAD